MGFLPYGPLPRGDTKGGACPPLESPAYPPNILFGAGYSRGAWGVAPLARGRSPLEKPLWVEGFLRGEGESEHPPPLNALLGTFPAREKYPGVRGRSPREPLIRMAAIRM